MIYIAHAVLITALFSDPQLYGMELETHKEKQEAKLLLDVSKLTHVSNDWCKDQYHIPIPVIENGQERVINFYDPDVKFARGANRFTLTEYINGQKQEREIEITDNKSGEVLGWLMSLRSIEKIYNNPNDPEINTRGTCYKAPSFLWIAPDGKYVFYDFEKHTIEKFSKDELDVESKDNAVIFTNKYDQLKKRVAMGLLRVYDEQCQNFKDQKKSQRERAEKAQKATLVKDIFDKICEKHDAAKNEIGSKCCPLPIQKENGPTEYLLSYRFDDKDYSPNDKTLYITSGESIFAFTDVGFDTYFKLKKYKYSLGDSKEGVVHIFPSFTFTPSRGAFIANNSMYYHGATVFDKENRRILVGSANTVLATFDTQEEYNAVKYIIKPESKPNVESQTQKEQLKKNENNNSNNGGGLPKKPTWNTYKYLTIGFLSLVTIGAILPYFNPPWFASFLNKFGL